MSQRAFFNYFHLDRFSFMIRGKMLVVGCNSVNGKRVKPFWINKSGDDMLIAFDSNFGSNKARSVVFELDGTLNMIT